MEASARLQECQWDSRGVASQAPALHVFAVAIGCALAVAIGCAGSFLLRPPLLQPKPLSEEVEGLRTEKNNSQKQKKTPMDEGCG